jgi:tetratricopeptide (TPR) repeat protein
MNGLLDTAIAHHRCGRLDAAESGYRSLLAVEPDHDDALHLLGVTLCQKGRKLEALGWIERAIARRPEIAAYHGARGEVLRELGRDDEAAAALARALELDPNLATARNNLGLIHLRAGRLEAALASFDEAIRLRPGLTTARINRGEALGLIGRWDEAAASYREVLEPEPENAWVHAYLGYALVECGDVDRLDEAAAHCQRALELAPGLAQAHTNLGAVWVAMGRVDDALAAFRRAVAIDPSLAMPWNNIGRAEQQLGRFDAALAAYHEALARAPRSARFHANLAGLLAEQHRDAEAVARYRLALECEPGHAESLCGLGQSLLVLGRRDEACAALEKATRLRPRLPAPRLTLARIHAEDGDFEQSNAVARSVLVEFPRSADAYLQLATNQRERLQDDDLEAMIALLEHPYYGDCAVASLAFGVAGVLDGRGRYEEAARYFELSNARQARHWSSRGERFDPDRESRVVDDRIASFTPEFFRSIHGRGSPSRRPLFIVGMPRSGTTLTEQVLASHPSVFGAGELEDIMTMVRGLIPPDGGPIELLRTLRSLDDASSRDLAERHVDRLAELGPGAEHVVDKMPSNLMHLGFIAALWPEARIIVCRRDPRDVALSCWTTYFGAIRWANDLTAIARQIIDHDRLIAHWKAVLPIPLIEVVYEEFVADFEAQARRLVESVGLEWHPACLDFHTLGRPIRTASLRQVRRPIYSRSVGRWRHYEAALAPLLDVFARHGHPLPSRLE